MRVLAKGCANRGPLFVCRGAPRRRVFRGRSFLPPKLRATGLLLHDMLCGVGKMHGLFYHVCIVNVDSFPQDKRHPSPRDSARSMFDVRLSLSLSLSRLFMVRLYLRWGATRVPGARGARPRAARRHRGYVRPSVRPSSVVVYRTVSFRVVPYRTVLHHTTPNRTVLPYRTVTHRNSHATYVRT